MCVQTSSARLSVWVCELVFKHRWELRESRSLLSQCAGSYRQRGLLCEGFGLQESSSVDNWLVFFVFLPDGSKANIRLPNSLLDEHHFSLEKAIGVVISPPVLCPAHPPPASSFALPGSSFLSGSSTSLGVRFLQGGSRQVAEKGPTDLGLERTG